MNKLKRRKPTRFELRMAQLAERFATEPTPTNEAIDEMRAR